METFRQIIKRHNKLFSHRNKQKIHNLCNWREKNNFSMNGNFRVENVVYKGVASATEGKCLHWRWCGRLETALLQPHLVT